MSEKDRKIVGSPLNFRGLVYGPINEQGVVYLFGLVAEDLNIRVESIQQGYPDCTAVRYVGKGRWERIDIEFEYVSSNFDHDPDKCDVLVCWEDDLPERARPLTTTTTTNHDDGRRLVDNQLLASIYCIPDPGDIYGY